MNYYRIEYGTHQKTSYSFPFFEYFAAENFDQAIQQLVEKKGCNISEIICIDTVSETTYLTVKEAEMKAEIEKARKLTYQRSLEQAKAKFNKKNRSFWSIFFGE